MEENKHITLVKNLLSDLAAGKSGEEISVYYHPSIKQIEYPNALNVHGGISDFKTIIDRVNKGKQFVRSQDFDIQREFECGNTVIVEIVWRASFTIPVGNTQAGEEIKAFFALFVEFENEKIIAQRNYDCFPVF
ncbi:MAG TPA: nuclear transport factor 2 family protein [Bacteroidia bacterium]|nr:nuclear transport factor 2 family protein [Bacteroidia bacterium]